MPAKLWALTDINVEAGGSPQTGRIRRVAGSTALSSDRPLVFRSRCRQARAHLLSILDAIRLDYDASLPQFFKLAEDG